MKKIRIITMVVGLFAVTVMLAGALKSTDNQTPYGIQTQKDSIKQNLTADYEDARYRLVMEVDKYITGVSPKSRIDPFLMVDLCKKYNVDIRFVLAQGQIESHFATKGTASRTLSIFNVGAYNGHSSERQRRNGFGYTNPNESIEPYLQLITNDYMTSGKTEIDLMRNFVNDSGMRYASNKNYESMLKSVYNHINSLEDFRIAYENYLKSHDKLYNYNEYA